MDNQQERLITSVDRAWLGGIIDGEGNISLHCMLRKGTKPLLYPRIQVTNNNQELLDECFNILQRAGVGGHFYSVLLHGKRRPKHLQMNGMKRVQSALQALIPYIRVKRRLADLLWEFVNSRLKKPEKTSPYTLPEWWCFQEMRRLNLISGGAGNRQQEVDKYVISILRDYTPSPNDFDWVMI